MKPPPGPMIQLGPSVRRPARPQRRPVPNPTLTATTARRSRSSLAALALAVGLIVGGAALLAPYAGSSDHPTDATAPVVVDGR